MTNSNEKSLKFLKRQPRLGDVVQVKTTLQEGTVRFIGDIHFKTGTWVGIELFENGTGKNNGTIKGVTYFKCPEKTGLLVMATSVNILRPEQKVGTNSQKASIVSKTIFKQPRNQRKSISQPNEPVTPTDIANTVRKQRKSISIAHSKEPPTLVDTTDSTRKIRTLPRATKTPVIKIKPRPKSQINKSPFVNKPNMVNKLDRISEEKNHPPPTNANINTNITMNTNPKETSIFKKNKKSPNSSTILLPNNEADAGISVDSDAKNINDVIINDLQNTLVHLKDIVSGLAEEYDKKSQRNIQLITDTLQQENDANTQDGIITAKVKDDVSHTQEIDPAKEKEYLDDNEINNETPFMNYSSSGLLLNNSHGENHMVRQSMKKVTDNQHTITELSVGLVNAQQEVRKLKDNQMNINRELNNYKEENKSLIKKIADLENQNKSLEEISSKEHYINELETKNKTLNAEYEQVKNELFFAKKNIEELYRKLEYNDSPKNLLLYSKYSNRSETRIARPKTFISSKRNASFSNIYSSKPQSLNNNGSSDHSFSSETETKINETLLEMKEENDKLILENETLHEEMEMLKNTLLDVQDDRENSSNHFLEKMEYQEKKYEDLKLRYHQVEAEKTELLNHIKNISSNNSEIELPPVATKAASTSSVEDTMIVGMKNLIADMEVTLNKTIVSEKEARSNFDTVNKLYEASKVKMDTLKQELEQRKMDYHLLSESNEELARENNELKQALEEMSQNQKQIKSNSITNEEFQEQYDQLKKQFEASKSIIEDKEAEIINYDVQCSQLESQIIDFEKQLSMKQNEIDCLLEKYQTLEKAYNSHDMVENERDNIIQDQINKICMLEETNKNYKDENNLLKIHNEENINEISKLNKIKSELELEIQMASKENNDLKNKEKLREETNAAVTTNATDNITVMKQEIQEKNNQIEELTRQNNALSDEVKISNEKFIKIQTEKEKVDKDIEELVKRHNEITKQLDNMTLKYEEDKKHYEEEINEINMDRENSDQHAKEEIESIINQLTETRNQFEIKIDQLENSKQMMQKKYETEIEDLNSQLQHLVNLQKQTKQTGNFLELSTLLDESERAKEVAESNAENRRKLLEKVILERDQLSQDLQSEKEKFLSLKGDYDRFKQRISELEKENLSLYTNKNSGSDVSKEINTNTEMECGYCEKLKQENMKLKKEIEELSIRKTVDVKEIDNTLKQTTEDAQKEREEKEILRKGYTLIWNSYISLEKECQMLLEQINEKVPLKEGNSPSATLHESPAIQKAQSESGRFRNSFNDGISPKNKMNINFDSIHDYTYDFDYDTTPNNTNILSHDIKEGAILNNNNIQDQDQSQNQKQNQNQNQNYSQNYNQNYNQNYILNQEQNKDKDQVQAKRESIQTNTTTDSHPSNYYYSLRQECKDKVPKSTISESSSNTLYSPKRRSSLINPISKHQSLMRTNPNRVRSLSNYQNQPVIIETLGNNDDTLYHKPEDNTNLMGYSSLIPKFGNSNTSSDFNNIIGNNNKLPYSN
jgi:hypothetical protein